MTNDNNQNPSDTPHPATELQVLEAFLGTWKLTGKNGSDAMEPNAKITGNVYYVWLPGHYYMTSNWHHKSPMNSHIGMSVIAYDSAAQHFSMQQFDNMGYHRTYIMENSGNKWTIKGENERGVIVFDSNGDSFTEDWEIKLNGGWKPLCAMKVIKI